jgi:hypothetical protein
MRERLNFTREQLKKVFGDYESLKEFERLIKLVSEIIPNTITNIEITGGTPIDTSPEVAQQLYGLELGSGIDESKIQMAIEALAQINSLALAIGVEGSSSHDLAEILALANSISLAIAATPLDAQGIIDALAISIAARLSSGTAEARSQQAIDAYHRALDEIRSQAFAPGEQKNNSVVTDYIDLPETGPHVTAPRRIQWNSADGTLDVGLYGGTVLQCGQEVHIYAKNDEAFTIENGRAVMLHGVVGASGKVMVALAIADGSIDENYMLGIATQDILTGEFGYITYFGLVRGFDTTGNDKTVPEAWADGNILYMDPAQPGELTIVEPTSPALDLPIAIVVHAGAGSSGSIAVRMKSGERVNSLHDVSAPTPRDLDLLQYSTANSRWEAGALPWVDIDFPIIVRTTGAGIPTLAAINGNITMPQWAVNDVTMCESQELIHSWVEGSTVYWHLHLTTNGLDATNRYVKFEVEYGYVDPAGAWTFPATLTTADLLIPASTTDKTMLILDLGNFAPAVHIGGHVVARLKRVAAAGAAPSNNPWIAMLQLHVQVNTMGSRSRSAK